MNKSDTLSKFAPAFLAAQQEIKAAAKDAENDFLNTTYANYESVVAAVKEPLNKQGIGYLHLITADGCLETMLLHESGEWISSTANIKIVPEYVKKEVKNEYGKLVKEIIPGTAYETPQAFGSSISYNKRYTLQGITGLPCRDDDDGEAAMKRDKKKAPVAPVKKPVTSATGIHAPPPPSTYRFVELDATFTKDMTVEETLKYFENKIESLNNDADLENYQKFRDINGVMLKRFYAYNEKEAKGLGHTLASRKDFIKRTMEAMEEEEAFEYRRRMDDDNRDREETNENYGAK